MCGIAGMIDRRLAGDCAKLSAIGMAMAEAIGYRGPDGSGVWSDPQTGAVLSHRRLAVVDVSPTGAQPMVSQNGRWVMSYNGEVYNARAIAREPELSGVAFRGTSDTEVILESVARRGLDQTLADLNGMFAIALWDRTARQLHLVRDRLGIKPLFFSTASGVVRFASELKALHACGPVLGSVDPASVASFLRFGYVPAPYSIFRDVSKVMPGEVVSIDLSGREKRRAYWSLAEAAGSGAVDMLDVSDAEAAELLHDLLARAVSDQMISDVPIGAFLSGGIDSSTVAALMVAAGRGPVRTFSIGFPEFGYDESAHAAAVARYLGTEHEQMVVTATDALAVVPRISEIYDEPFADSSQIPTYLLSKLTRRHVTVALSGDGGDELFGGYNRYRLAESFAATVLSVPVQIRRAAARLIDAVPDGAVEQVARLIPNSIRPRQPADKLKKAAEILPRDRAGIYLRLVSQCPEPAKYMRLASEHPIAWSHDGRMSAPSDFLRHMQVLDVGTYLPDDILQKVDRASMAFALEVRPPLLDHRVVEFAFRLPRRLQIRRGETKWLLRRVLDRYVPRPLIDRPKMGFGVPLADWLHGPLRSWADDLLDRRRFGGGLLDADAARQLWNDHLGRRRNNAYALWTLLMFEAWRRRWSKTE
jgi:asparagine synthase (glutamine-hydrolysing)